MTLKHYQKRVEVNGHLSGVRSYERLWRDYCPEVKPENREAVNVSYGVSKGYKYTVLKFTFKEEAHED